MNKKPVWVSPNPNWWWREHGKWATDIDLISPREWCIERAREIAKNQETEMKRQWVIWIPNSYGRDPFPPRHLWNQ